MYLRQLCCKAFVADKLCQKGVSAVAPISFQTSTDLLTDDYHVLILPF